MAVAFAALPVLAQRGGRDADVDIGSILVYIVVGLVVGLLARFLVPGKDPLGLVATLVIGVLGAVIGGYLAATVFEETEGVDWIASIIVAVVLVLLARAMMGGRGRRRRLL